MKARVASQDLKDAVDWAARSVSPRPFIPTLSGLRLDLADNRLTVTGTNLDSVAEDTVEAEGDGGHAIVPTKPLKAFLSAAADGPLTLTVTDDRLRVESRDGHIGLRMLPSEDWPERMPDAHDAVEVKGLDDALAAALPCVSADDNRPTLCGVHITSRDGRAWIESSDSYKAHRRRLAQTVDGPIIIRGEAASLAAKAGASTLAVDGNSVALGCAGAKRLRCSTIEGRFPDLAQLWPDGDGAGRITVEVAALEHAVAMASPTAEQLTNAGVQLHLTASGDDLIVASGNSHDGDGQGTAVCEHEGDELDVALSSKHLLAAAKSAADDDGSVVIDVRDALKPVSMRPATPCDDGRESLCMPVAKKS